MLKNASEGTKRDRSAHSDLKAFGILLAVIDHPDVHVIWRNRWLHLQILERRWRANHEDVFAGSTLHPGHTVENCPIGQAYTTLDQVLGNILRLHA